MFADDFDALLTFDKNLQFQQNFEKYPLPVLVLIAPKNNFDTLSPIIPFLLKKLEKPLPKGGIVVEIS